MKRLSYLVSLATACLTTVLLSTSSACNYRVDLYDSFGDGWNGGSLTIQVNGIPVLSDLTLASGYGPASIYFSVSHGDVITTSYTSGSWPDENYYQIYDSYDNLVFSDGMNNTTPLGGMVGNAVCPTHDLAVLDWLNPKAKCALGIDSITILITNQGLHPETGMIVSYSIDGGNAFIRDTLNDTINSGDSLVYTFSSPASFSSYGSYQCIASVFVNGDQHAPNDTLRIDLIVSPMVDIFPYYEGFETDDGHWTSGGTNNSWQWASPTGINLTTAYEGTKAWGTNPAGYYNNNEASWVESPCFDFTGLVNPEIEVAIWYDIDTWDDGAAFQYTTDGVNWHNVGQNGTGDNWFNDWNIDVLLAFGNGEGWTGESYVWLLATHNLAFLAGEPSVKFRFVFASDDSENDFDGFAFDAIRIYQPPFMQYVSCEQFHSDLSEVAQGQPNANILGVKVTTTGRTLPISINRMDFSYLGTSAPKADIASAKVYTTMGDPNFNIWTLYGATATNPDLLEFTEDRSLEEGDNYFWLVYDLHFDAAPGNVIDAQLDSIVINDTTRTPSNTAPAGNRTIIEAMEGTYIIDLHGGGDFLSFNEAVEALTKRGVKDSVTFLVMPGQYNERIIINPINGASAQNTILFKSYAEDPSSVTLGMENTTTTDNYIIHLQGADYITFRYLTIMVMPSLTKASYGTVIKLTNNADFNAFLNNHISGIQTTSTSLEYAVIRVLNYSEKLQIHNNIIENGSTSLYVNGYSYLGYAPGLEILYNTIIGFYYMGMNLQSLNGFVALGNFVANTGNYSTVYGIYAYSHYDQVNMYGNDIQLYGTGTRYPIYSVNLDANTKGRHLMANNFLSISQTSTNTQSGISLSNSSDVDIIHNSVRISSTTLNSRCLYLQNSPGTRILNNIFNSAGGSRVLHLIDTSSIQALNHNVYFTPGNTFANILGFELTWADYAQSGYSPQDIFTDPEFFSATDLHTTNPLINGKGTPIAEVPDDIDGDIRNLTHPDPGADEFTPPPIEAALIDIFQPLPGCGIGMAQIGLSILNRGSDTINGGLSAYYTLNGGAIIQASINTPIYPLDTLIYTFSNQEDFSTQAEDSTFTIEAWITLAGDANLKNDSLDRILISLYTPDAPTTSDVTVNFGEEATLTAVSTEHIYWYPNATTTNVIHQGETYISPPLYDNTSYYAAAMAPGQELKITELMLQWNATGANATYPSYTPSAEWKCVEISNLGEGSAALGGYQFEMMGATSLTYTFPSHASLKSGEVMLLIFYSVNPVIDDPQNNLYVMATDKNIGSYSSTGFILKDPSNGIIDAVGYYGYSFPPVSGVTIFDWSGTIYAGNRAGISRSISDNNRASDWYLPTNTNRQTIGSLNVGLTLNRGIGCLSQRSIATAFVTNVPLLGIPVVTPDTLTATILDCDGSSSFNITLGNIGDTILDWSTQAAQQLVYDSTSYTVFTTSAAITNHSFHLGSSLADTLFITITLNGDFSDANEYCNLSIDGTSIGTLNDFDLPDGTDIEISMFFTGTSVQTWAADGIITVSLSNSSYVGSGWGSSSHKVRLRTNGKASWINVPNTNGSIAISGTNNLNVSFNASGLTEGTYTSTFPVSFSNPRHAKKFITCILTLIGAPEVTFSDTCHNLGHVMQHTQVTNTYTLYNTGCDTLLIDSLSVSSPAYQAYTFDFVVVPGEPAEYSITFGSDQVGSFPGLLTFHTNIGDQAICLQGSTYNAPTISVDPDTLTASLLTCDDSTTLSFTLYNNGLGTLTYEVLGVGLGGSVSPACIPFTSNYCCEMGILQVQFANINHISGNGSEGYQDYSMTKQAQLLPGQSYPIYIQTGPQYSENVRVWIDWNDNGVFETPEIVMTSLSTYQHHSGTINIPSNAVYGKVLRMRVASDYYNQPTPEPCGSVYYGQHEDYGIMLPSGIEVANIASTLAPQSDTTIDVIFRSKNLKSGQHQWNILITSNDPLNQEIHIVNILNLTGLPEIDVQPMLVDFDSAMIGAVICKDITVYNPGCSTLVINNITPSIQDFYATTSNFQVPPGDSVSVSLCFLPQSAGLINGSVEFQNNAQSSVVINVVGLGLPAPNISVNPDSFDLLVQTCSDTLNTILNISNTGSVPLTYTISSNTGTTSLDSTLSALNQEYSSITSSIPNIFYFIDGVTGNYIPDGNNDMYDNGNYLNTNLNTNIPYSDNQVVSHASFGTTGKYFTRKLPGLWVMAADIDAISHFEITGNLGADGSGLANGTILSTSINGLSYLGYLKRVYNTNDPSVNHLIIVSNNPATSHTFSTNTDNDQHMVSGLDGIDRIYYLLYAGSGGAYIDDNAALNIMNAFLSVVNPSPAWIQLSLSEDTVSVGGNSAVGLSILPHLLPNGNYSAFLKINSNDPDEPEILIPFSMTLEGSARIQLSENQIDFGPTMMGTGAQSSVIIYNTGCDTLTVNTLDYSHATEFSIHPLAPLDILPYDSLEINITFHPSLAAQVLDTLWLRSNVGDSAITMSGLGIPEPIISTSPNSFNINIIHCDDTISELLTIYNTGLGDLNYQIIGGYGNSYDSTTTKYYSTSGATTTHTFSNLPTSSDSVILIITINGDFDYQSEYASLYIDGQFITQIDDGNPTNGTNIVRTYSFGYLQVLNWLADGVIQVQVQNSNDVDHWSGLVSMHQVQLIINFANWMNLSNYAGIIPSGDSSQVIVWFGSEDLFAGTYYSKIQIASNDPYDPIINVPCTLNLIGQPEILLSESCIYFDTILVGNYEQDTLIIYNTGCAELQLSSLNTSNSAFSLIQAPLVIPPEQQGNVIIRFTPGSAMIYEDTLIIQTNIGETQVCLNGTGAAPPILNYSPAFFHASIQNCDDTLSTVLAISNVGVEDLYFTLSGSNEDTVRILAVIYASSTTLLNQLITAINQQFSKYTLEIFNSPNAAGLQASLSGKDVVIIPRFTSTASATYSAFGPILQSFANQGGVIIFSGTYESSYSQNMYATGLFSGSYASYITAGNITLTNLSDPLLQGMPGTLSASQYVFYHTFTNPDLVTLASYGGYHVMAYRNIGKGSVLYFGYDLTTNQALATTILTRMVELGRKGLFPNWLILNQTSGTVQGGQSMNVDIKFDALGLDAGYYASYILIHTNVPGSVADTIPCTLTLTGNPAASLPQSCVDIGSVMIGGSLNGSFTITNTGCADLIITSTSHIQAEFSYTLPAMTLGPGSSYLVNLGFSSGITGNYTDTISINSNAGILKVCIQAIALSAPEVEITPTNLSATILSCNDSTQLNISISNPGNATLNWSVPSQINPGFSLLFDGVDDYVNLGTWNTGNRWTLEAWVNPSSIPTGRRTIAGAVHQCADWAISMVDGQFALIIKPTTAICSYILYSGIYPIPGTWYHVSGTSNGNIATLMVNGEVMATANVAVNYSGTTSGVRIGGEYCCYGNNFPGRIDDVRIWNLARTSPQIKTTMFSDLSGNEAGLVGYWPMNEGNGAILNDLSTMTRNGSIIGPIWVPDTKPSSWITAHPSSGVVGISTTDTIGIMFRSKGLYNGTFIKNLIFTTDDPVHPQVSVACTLTVDGQGELSLPPGCLAFPSIMQHLTTSLALTVQNTGCEDVSVSSITFGNASYSVQPSSFNLIPGTAQTLQVTFSPTLVGNHNTSMTINSDVGVYQQCVLGEATERPVAQFNNDTITGIPSCSYSEYGTMTISNLGSPYLNTNFSMQPPVSWASLVTPSPVNVSGGSTSPIIILFDKTGLTTGTYQTHLIINTNDPLTPVYDVLVRLIVPNVLAPVNLGIDTAGCIGQTITLNAGSGYAVYAWSTSASTQTIQVNTTGEYKVTVTDVYGCISTDSIYAGFYNNPVVSAGSDRLICEGEDLNIIGSVSGLPDMNQVDIVIGSGQSYTSNNTATPFKTLFADGRTQLLYSKNELIQYGFSQGLIETIGIMVGTAGTPGMNSFTIKMAEVGQGSLTGFISSQQTVYTRSSYQPITGWNNFVLDQPFLYSGQGNLLVEICFNNLTWSANSSVQYSPVSNSVWGAACDNCGSGCNITGGSGSHFRANLRIIGDNMRATYTWSGPGGFTSSSYQLNIPNIQNTEAGEYILHVDNGWGCESEDTVLVTVTPTPVVDAGLPSTILEGESILLVGSISGGISPYTVSWSPAASLSDPTVIDPLATPPTTTTYSLVVTGANGCQASDQTTITVTPVHNLDGRLYYENTATTGLNDVKLVLNTPQGVYDSLYTDISGSYHFRAPQGSYFLTPYINKTWGGVNSTDALEVAKHAVYITTLTGLRLAAADVNQSGTVNATDALLIMRRYVGLSNSFPLSDWLYNNGGMIGLVFIDHFREIKAICAGDVNASYIPGKEAASMVTLQHIQSSTSAVGGHLDLPFYTKDFLETGAVSLELIIPKTLGKVITVQSNMDGLVFHQEGERLRIAWHSTQPIVFQQDDAIFHLVFDRAYVTDDPVFIHLGQGSEVASQDGQAIVAALYTLPVVNSGSTYRLGENYPDPFDKYTHIPYYLPEDASVSITLHDMLGRQLLVLDQGRRLMGSHMLTFDGSTWQPGVYFYRLQINGKMIDSPAHKMVISR